MSSKSLEKGQNYLLIGTVVILVLLACFFLVRTSTAQSSSTENESTDLIQE